MATIKLDIVTAESQVFAEDVNMILAEGIEGQMAILPKHAPLITMLKPGELLIRNKDNDEIYMALSGGFMEVRPDKIIILADACERSEEIDIERAEQAKRRAEERLKSITPELNQARAEAALRRSIARLLVAEKRRKKASGFRQ